jgi:hypothetical protein
MNRQDLYFHPETYPRVAAKVKSRPEIHLNGQADFKEVDGVQGHFKNFIASIKGTEKPIAPPPVGQEAAIGGHMATIAYIVGPSVCPAWCYLVRAYSSGGACAACRVLGDKPLKRH